MDTMWFVFRDLFTSIIRIMERIECFGINLWQLTLGALVVTIGIKCIRFLFFGSTSDKGDT